MRGIDVSEHQGNIDWASVKSQIDFAILRLGWIGNHDNHTIDSKFERNYNECKRLGIPVGVYVYNYCVREDTARSGADWTVEKLQGKTLELPVYIDMEDTSGEMLGKDLNTAMCISFNSVIEASGRWAGVYANKNWFDNFLNKDVIKSKYTTWIAHYGVNPDRYTGEYDMLQYTSSGYVDGIGGNVDMNEMYRDLISEINGSMPQPTPQPTKKSNEEIADEVIAGLWGNQPERQQRLEEEGYDYQAIQDIVNQKLGYHNEQTYVVKAGDTLSGIASMYGTTYQELARKNGIENPNLIFPGQIIRI